MWKNYRKQIKERHCIPSSKINGYNVVIIYDTCTTEPATAAFAYSLIHSALEVHASIKADHTIFKLPVSIVIAVVVHDPLDPAYKMGEHLHPIIALPSCTPY